MGSSTVSMPSQAPGLLKQDVPFGGNRIRLVNVPEMGNRSSRGAIIGVTLGAGLWSLIAVLSGVIKL